MDNKWKNAAIPALLIHISIGSVYCWSLFKEEIATRIGMSTFSVGWCFSLAIFFLGMSAAFAGKFVERNIHASSKLACIMFGTGFIGTGIVVNHMRGLPALILIYLLYGVVMGIGLGVGYITPIKTLMLWFEDNKGLATGISIAGFGLAKSIASPLMSILITRYGITEMFVTLGIVYVVMMWIASILLKKPSWWKEEESIVNRASYVLRDKEFILIWIMFYLNVHNGLMIISYEKQILSNALSGVGILPLAILVVPSLSALFNAAGRIGYSTLSDRYATNNITRAVVYALIIGVSCILSINVASVLKSQGGACPLALIVPYLLVINAGYGGGFSTLPALLSERFGMKNISQIHGLALSAWGVAGVTGNNLTEVILKNTNSYGVVIYVTGVLYAIAFFCCYMLCNCNKREELSRVSLA